MKKIVTIVQARMGSSRLPGKVLKPVMGKPLLLYMLQRVNNSALKGSLVVATTNEVEDDAIEKFCGENNFLCYRGSRNDLLDRHYNAALLQQGDAVVKIPSDCPLVDAKIIDKVLDYFLQNDFDFVSNMHPATYPDGNDIEVMTIDALKTAWKEASKPFEREHTTPYLWENPEKFKIGNVAWETGLDYSMTHRWTLDYAEDFDFIKAVYEKLYPAKHNFSLEDILDLTRRNPGIFAINSKYAGVNWYRNHLNELKTISPNQTKQIV